ncbi:MAG: gliding motility-associated C-terminal domain-containing protein [Saprospiraceae bacterium]|nr:gliding motility-associated C-terminal domain-containing protein [Saprospiraceae bacterium]
MKNYIFVLSSFFLCGNLTSQVQLTIATVSGNKNDTVQVPVTVTGFNNILATQYSFSYDSNVLAIVDVIKTANYDVNFSTHVGSASVKNGQIGFTWDAPGGTGKNINNGATLFTLRFKLIGKECDSSFVQLTSKPTSIEVLDGNFENVNLTANTGKVKINGPGCQGGGPPPDTSGLQIIAATETTPAGVVKCIKVTTKNFKLIQTGQFTMHWNTAVAVFDTLNSAAWSLSWGQNYAALPDRSGVQINWDAGRDPLTLADNTTLFEVCLRPVGAAGSMTDITFDGTPVVVEFTNGNGDVVPVKFTSGKLTITAAPAKTLNLYVRDTTVEACGEFCIPIRVDGFKCVQNFQFSMKFDNTKLKFNRISSINLPNLGSNNFNVVKDSIRVTWDSQTGPQDLANGASMFSVCFESLLVSPPDCPFDTKIQFTDLLGSPLEFSDCVSDNFAVIKGEPELTVTCCPVITPVTITLGTKTNARCFGDCNGSVTGTQIAGGKGPFRYEWQLQPSQIVISTVLSPNDLCPGDYRLVVIDEGNGNARTTSTVVTITQPDELKCTAVITHVQTVNDGKIDLTVMGGTGPYTFLYVRLPNRTNPKTEEDPMNLSAGNWELTLKDANGCTKIDTFTINPPPIKVVSIVYLDSVRCFGDCKARLNVSASGGSTPYQLAQWSNGDRGNIADSLCAGTYTVTVTDAGGNTATGSFTVTEPDEIVITLDSTKRSSGSDGAIYTTGKGGTPSFTYQWRNANGQVISNTEDLINCAPGTYVFCITDRNSCIKCDTFICDAINTTPPTITVNLKIDPKLGNQPVSCRGLCDGKIFVEVTSTDPKLPYKYKWSHDSTLNSNTATNLCPNISYRVTVTDAAGNTKISSSLLLPDAPAIDLTVRKLACASTNIDNNGRYEALLSGATAPITYSWCNGNSAVIANDLPSGNCTLSITDANGCTASEEFTVCVGMIDNECYKSRLVISPNGDGFNEFFEINCVQNFENTLTIYDRWGNQVFAAVNYLNTWDGKDDDGNTLTEGTYMWILKVLEPGKNDQYFKGTVTIVR